MKRLVRWHLFETGELTAGLFIVDVDDWGMLQELCADQRVVDLGSYRYEFAHADFQVITTDAGTIAELYQRCGPVVCGTDPMTGTLSEED